MDLTSLLGAFMGDEALTSIGTASNTSAGDVASVLSAALPSLIAGANAQAYDEKTAESFANALNQHSKDDVNDIVSFVNNVDVNDGKKVVQHLLGDQTKETTEEISNATGVSRAKTGTILAIAAPLLLSLLSGNSNQNTTSSTTSLLGSLLGGGNSSSGLGAGAVMAMAAPLLLNMLNNKPAQTAAANQTLQSASTTPAVDTSGATSLLGNLLSGLGGSTAAQQQTQQQSSGSLLGSLLGGGTQQQTQQQSGGSLLGSLLGGGTQQQVQQQPQQQTQEQSSGGLLSGLLGLLK